MSGSYRNISHWATSISCPGVSSLDLKCKDDTTDCKYIFKQTVFFSLSKLTKLNLENAIKLFTIHLQKGDMTYNKNKSKSIYVKYTDLARISLNCGSSMVSEMVIKLTLHQGINILCKCKTFYTNFEITQCTSKNKKYFLSNRDSFDRFVWVLSMLWA